MRTKLCTYFHCYICLICHECVFFPNPGGIQQHYREPKTNNISLFFQLRDWLLPAQKHGNKGTPHSLLSVDD